MSSRRAFRLDAACSGVKTQLPPVASTALGGKADFGDHHENGENAQTAVFRRQHSEQARFAYAALPAQNYELAQSAERRAHCA
jgi:hypothetical protein